MSDQSPALAQLVENIEILRARVDELERRANAALEESNRKLTTSNRSQAEDRFDPMAVSEKSSSQLLD